MTAAPSSSAGAPSEGLDTATAQQRLAEHGPNQLVAARATPAWVVLGRQFGSALVILLLLACVVSAFLGEVADAIAIGVIVVINAVVGFVQESRAERAVLALRSMTAPRARLLRDGRQVVIAATEVVPGDVLVLEAGDVVAADARLTEAHALKASEAALTGESAPVDKSTRPAAPDAPLAERHDRVFMGTSIAAGTGRAVVTATGMRTEMGRIANLLQTAETTETPLQARLARVGRSLLIACLGIVVATAVLGLLHHQRPFDVFMSAISLAVAAVPEGLPAIVTIALAIGVRRMAARHVLVRRLPAVETLGSATVVCTDKTGTLTTGVMEVRDLWGAAPPELLRAAAACCDAELGHDGKPGVGDPTELAILQAAAGHGVHRQELERDNPRRATNPFDADRKRMSVLRADGVLYAKGAFESLRAIAADEAAFAEAHDAAGAMAARGLRVLAIGQRPAGTAANTGVATSANTDGDVDESGVRLLGLVGIADPPRAEAIAAVRAAREAGIRTVMITGDHPDTARAIAREMDITRPGDDEASAVHARATPEEKLTIVRQLKTAGDIVAMTGDGVNDAPALREAHIGIAMGRTGTEVTREASDMVLADDNFASIVAAIREGRGIFANIRKTLVYLLGGNAGELLIMLGAAAAGLPLPLLPLHLLWINLATDGLPALMLVMDPPEDDLMQRPPRAPREPMLGRVEWATVAFIGLVEGGATLAVFTWAWKTRDLDQARDLAFVTLVFAELLRSFAARSRTRLFWEVGALSNVRLVLVVFGSMAAQIGLHYVPVTQELFRLAPLSLADIGLAVGVALVPVSVLEVGKLIRRWAARGAGPAREERA